MADGFALGRARVERAPANLRRDRDFSSVGILDKGVGGPLRAPQKLRRRPDVRRLLRREGERSLKLHQRRNEEPRLDRVLLAGCSMSRWPGSRPRWPRWRSRRRTSGPAPDCVGVGLHIEAGVACSQCVGERLGARETILDGRRATCLRKLSFESAASHFSLGSRLGELAELLDQSVDLGVPDEQRVGYLLAAINIAGRRYPCEPRPAAVTCRPRARREERVCRRRSASAADFNLRTSFNCLAGAIFELPPGEPRGSRRLF